MPDVVYHADIEQLSGKQSDQVYTKARSGPTRRSRVPVRNPNSPQQAIARINFGRASIAYSGLSLDGVTAWNTYAASLRWINTRTGVAYVPSGNMVFSSLATKFLQLHPGGTIPLTPPDAGFPGDPFVLTVSTGAGHVTFTAPAANGADTTTELMLQPLPKVTRRPTPGGYNLRSFFAFAAGTLTHNVPVPAGVYAVGYRFVNTMTGQFTTMVTLGIVQVLA